VNFTKISFLTFISFLTSVNLLAYDPHANLTKDNKLPKDLEGIGFSDVTGKQLKLDIEFIDDQGNPAKLSQYFGKGKPILLSPVYFKCPTLCNYHMNGVMKVLKALDFTAGKEFEYLAVSFNSKETTQVSKPKKAVYIKEYGRKEAESGFHLLTGDDDSINALLSQLQFRYTWDEESKQFIHASGIYVLTPSGQVSRIFQGIQFDERDLKLAFTEASEGKIGSFVDRFALFCFQFDPRKNKYTIYAYRIMQMGGGVTLLVLASFLFINWRKISKNNRQGVI